tara:strand:- start:966 stop:1541 length:576 start_codon:yes stop_codon:yes gene_type:complete
MIENIFSIPVYKTTVNNFNLIQEEVEDGVDIIGDKFGMREDWGTTHYISDVTFSDNIIQECGMKVLKKEIHKHVEEYKKRTPFGNMFSRFSLAGKAIITASWITKFKKGNFSSIHDHGMDDISGCYYYKTSGKDGDFFYESSSPWGGRVTIPPAEGQLLLFPSWVKHGVLSNETDDIRMSLAFNIAFDRKK